jgi:Nucleotidyl transferase AbiEii toxin, Type IV TA system
MLNTDFLAPKTAPIFEALRLRPELQGMVLVGGTALALQVGHRLSEDLDFWLPGSRLNLFTIDVLMRDLLAQGRQVFFANDPNKAAAFRINSGENLAAFAQDWVVDGVKLQFFCRLDAAYTYFSSLPRHRPSAVGCIFEVASPQMLLHMKSWLIHERVRSRDLFDLWYFLRTGNPVEMLIRSASKASVAISEDYAKQVLIGKVPLDAQDEGFASLTHKLTLAQIHADFASAINAWEVELARAALQREGSRLE